MTTICWRWRLFACCGSAGSVFDFRARTRQRGRQNEKGIISGRRSKASPTLPVKTSLSRREPHARLVGLAGGTGDPGHDTERGESPRRWDRRNRQANGHAALAGGQCPGVGVAGGWGRVAFTGALHRTGDAHPLLWHRTCGRDRWTARAIPACTVQQGSSSGSREPERQQLLVPSPPGNPRAAVDGLIGR